MIGFYDYTVLATYAATALGVTGMFQAVEGRHLTAVFCLLAAGLLDCFDGRIARTKKDRSHQQQSFGIQIDSLNDVLCFGALPSVAGYCAWSRWSDAPTPVWYGAALCVFTLAGLIRLAYFNVTEEENQAKGIAVAAGGNTIWACPSQPVPWSFRCFTCWACCCPAGRISWRQECCCWRRCM